MKKINLIEWLSRNSHEKQKPQRFGRYAAMLIMLLTLGVGQMWATDTYVYVDLTDAQTSNPSYQDEYSGLHYWNGSSDVLIQLKSNANSTLIKTNVYRVLLTDAKGWRVCRTNGSDRWNDLEWNSGTSNNYVKVTGTTCAFSSIPSSFFTQSKYIYYRIQSGYWDNMDASMILNFYLGDNKTWLTNAQGTPVETNGSYKYYYVTVPNGYTTHMQALRYNSDGSVYWGGKTNTITAPTGSNNTIVNDATNVGENQSVSWTTYAPPMASVTLSDNGTAILAGGGTELNPYLIATGATIKVVASGTKTVADPDATIWYDIKDNTTSKQNSSTAACSFTASATANTVYQMKVDGYTKVSSTSSSTLTSDIIYYKTVSVKNISVYIYVGGCTSDQINSIELFGTPYVGSVALDAVHKYIGDFTTDGDWRKYTFTNVSEIQNLVVARSGGRAVDNITATADVYYMYNGTELDGKCVPRANPTWGTAPASGAIGGSMTATVSGAPDGATTTWTSTNTSVATVNSSTGAISYKAAGNTTIKANVSWSASGGYCAGSYELSQAITVTSGATVTATRTCPAYVSTGAGEVTLDITSTGASSGWYYRIKNKSTGGYYAPDNQSAASNALSWTMTGGIGAELTTLVVELYNGSNTLICTSSDVTVTGEVAHITYIAAGSNGSVSPTTIYANDNHVHPSITATPKSHYHFVEWKSNNAAASVASTTSATTTVTATAGGYTITASFAGDEYDIRYYDQGGGAFLGTQSEAPTTHTYGTATTLKIPTKTGYAFGGWYTESDCDSGAVGDANSASLGATAYTGNITLYAKWTEKTVTVSPTCAYDAGDPSYSDPTASNSGTVGIVSTSQLVAPAAGTGYTFAGWTLSSNLVVTSGNAATDRTITVRTNGDGEAVTATAKYNEVLDSRWHLVGQDVASKVTFPNGWTIDNTSMMQKATGHSTESVVSADVTVSNASGTYEFKVVDDNDANDDIWYGYSSDDNGNQWLVWTGTATNTVYTGSGNTHNLKFTPTVAGTYKFKVDYSGSNPAVTITYPTSYTLTYSIGDVVGNDGDISTSPSMASGSKVISGTNITLTAPAADDGYTWKGWYTNAAGTTGKIDDVSRAITITVNADKSLYACYTINNHAINYTAPSHGSYTIKVGTADVVSENTTSDYGKQITLAATPATGYHFVSWSVKKTSDASVSVTVTDNKFAMPDYPVTVSATFAANTYSVTFDANGGTGDAMSAQAFTFDEAQELSANTYTRTGYDFDGWATEADGAKFYNPGQSVSNLTATNGGTFPLFAHWTAKSYTVTLNINEANHGTIAGKATSASVTFDAAPTAIAAGQLPTAAQGYAFMGFFTAAGGEGVQVINANGTWIASVTGYTDASGNWVKPEGITLYAYYKKAEITALTLDNAVVAPSGTVGVTPTVAPTPEGTNSICWKLLYSNGNLYSPQPTFSPTDINNKVTFDAPSTSGTYLIAAVLRTGNECNGGTKLDSVTSAFQVAGDHTVTVQYKCGDEVIRASASVTGKPLEATEITAPDIVGYTFSKWKAGDGITIEGADGNGEKASATINFTAIYDGKLTAIYTKKQMIYFNNTLGWEHVYVYFYKDGYYWGNNNQGTGTEPSFYSSSYTGIYGEMTKIGESNIYYYDMTANSATSYTNVAFTSKEQNNAQYFYDGNNVIRRVDDYSASLSMYVPLAGVEPEAMNSNTANYYHYGYWMNYPESTGYTLKIYNKKEKANDSDKAPEEIRSIPFEFTADKTMPMELDVDLEAGKTYGFKIYCNNDDWLGNNGTMTATTPNWELNTGTSNCGLTTTAAGNYRFTLNYFAVSSTDYKLRIGVTYPVAAGDYQVLYKDDTMSKWFISSVVPAASDKDTVSFFVRKDENPVLKLQKCGSVGEGTVTWSDTVANLISVLPSAITQDSVYIFCLNKNAEGKRELGDVKAYTGNYYIRTDCAGTTKWDNYRAADHLMTYSEYSEKNSDFTHYFVAHVNSGVNVKYVIANDYSPNISDTLAQQDGDVSTTPAYTHVNTNGFLQANANVRFMWNRHNNNVVRAYLADAQTDGLEFLVLRANSSDDMKDENGNNLINSANSGEDGYNHKAPNNSIQFTDSENWIYEASIKIKPGAFVKLYAKFDNGYFYFKGVDNSTFDASNAIQLMEGTGDLQKVRVVFDFKTDRLLAAWVPEDATIETEHKINADVMFVREGQGDVAQLTFGSSGKISAIKSAYGVMRFNKWTLNNKDKDSHTVLPSPKSIYERSLFWISFPFKVKLNDVFGFGTYGTHWAIQKYNGVRRAAEGFWAESSGFWEWMDRNTEYLEPDQGYLLAIDLDLLGEDNTAIWGPDSRSEQIELYFPSYGTMPDITSAAVEHTLPSHACEIDWSGRSNGNGGTLGPAYNRTVIDSHWNVMSVPTYVNTENIAFTDNDDWITEAADGKHGPNFLYTWNPDDNTLTATAGEGYTYHAMHAYMVQYYGDVTWTASSGSPYPIVARRTYAEQPKKVNFCLEIQQNEKMLDRTFVQLSDDEEVSAEFSFGEDMGKEFNSRKANIYTVIEGYLPAAGNTLPMSDQTTLVPVGVKTTAAGEYTFAMPDGTNGVSVVLIDNIAGTRTNLALSDYTVALGKGDLSDRFMLEIAPIKQMPTDIENVQGGDVQGAKARKVMVDGILYIVKDGKVFDARGAKVK